MFRILIAEDEPGVRSFVTRALELQGYDVECVADGSEALEALERAHKIGVGYDLLLTDIMMPVMDGIALALRASRDAPDMHIILMTGFADQRERAHQLEKIIDDVVLKPFTLADLKDRVAAVLAA